MSDKVDHTGVHATHCCVLHGCKYGDEDCPVVNRTVKQAYPCEMCDMDDIKDIPNPDDPDYEVFSWSDQQLREEVLRFRKERREQPAFNIVVTPVRQPYPIAARGEGTFYAYLKDKPQVMGSFGSSPAEAIGWLVITTALKGPFTVQSVDPEPHLD